jgi:hypothetical protein
MVAIAVTLNDPNRVASVVKAGSDVALFSDVPSKNTEGVRPILDRVKVLYIGGTGATAPAPTPSGGAAATLPQTLLTLELRPEDAATVLFASANGTLWFAALGKDAVVPTTPGNGNNLYNRAAAGSRGATP